MTRPFAEVIGDPIAHSKSPAIHTFWLEKLGIEGGYRSCRITAEGLGDYLAQRRTEPAWRGCNITVPHKIAAMAHVDRIDPAARMIGAINTVIVRGGLEGHNTDCQGFAEPLRGRSFDHAVVIGAGGAARAVLAALAHLGVERVTIQNRSVPKAEALLREFGLAGTATALESEPSPAQLLVNTSSLGMIGQPELPAVERCLAPGGVAYDIVYAPLETRFLAAARARGAECIDGLAMLIGQAAVAFELFFGHTAPREHDGELRRSLTS